MFKEFDKKADEILAKLSLKEKIGQLNQVKVPSGEEETAKVKEMIRNGHVGSIILASCATAGNDDKTKMRLDFFNSLQETAVKESKSGIPMIFGRDVIHGHHTVYPIPLASAAAFNDELVEHCYRNIAWEATADGINWTFSPMLDMSRDPRWGRMVEGPGEDPYVGARLAAACVKGFQGDDLTDEYSLVACAKHYIGYGASEGGRDYHRTEISDYSLYNYYLPAFRAAVDAGIGTVMSSFNDINGVPMGLSKKYLTDILRGKLGFEGFVISDWDQIVQLIKQGVAETKADCAALALGAGVDMDMNDGCYVENLEKLVADGIIPEEVIDTAVRRILRIKLACGLFDRPYTEFRKVDRTHNIEDARTMASECMILLKNNDNLLPLSKDKRFIAAGPYLRERRSMLGTWAPDGTLEGVPTFLEAIANKVPGKAIVDMDSEWVYNNLPAMSSDADVVVLALGESRRATGEMYSVCDISISDDQVRLAKQAKLLGKKVVGVFFCGRPMALEKIECYLDAMLYAWHGGSETANAACDVLFGDVVPSGKTPVTFPRTTGQIPIYYNATSAARPVNGYYGECINKIYVDGLTTPMYPFGYGLSYTTFEYSGLASDKDSLTLSEINEGKTFKVSVDVANTGDFDGKEVVQLYIRDKIASVMRPMRELKNYKKVLIAKGEKAHIEFELGYKDLGFYLDTGDYTLEAGEFEIFVGTNCLKTDKISVWVK